MILQNINVLYILLAVWIGCMAMIYIRLKSFKIDWQCMPKMIHNVIEVFLVSRNNDTITKYSNTFL